MTLAEKGCGRDHVLEIGGPRHATMKYVADHLEAHLNPDVWLPFTSKLGLA